MGCMGWRKGGGGIDAGGIPARGDGRGAAHDRRDRGARPASSMNEDELEALIQRCYKQLDDLSRKGETTLESGKVVSLATPGMQTYVKMLQSMVRMKPVKGRRMLIPDDFRAPDTTGKAPTVSPFTLSELAAKGNAVAPPTEGIQFTGLDGLGAANMPLTVEEEKQLEGGEAPSTRTQPLMPVATNASAPTPDPASRAASDAPARATRVRAGRRKP